MVRLNAKVLKEASNSLNKNLSEILVCPLSKQPLRFCEETNSLISDAIGVSFREISKEYNHYFERKNFGYRIRSHFKHSATFIKDGIPCLVPKDGKILDLEDETKPEADVESSAKQ